jgi:hypothetical protein
MVSVFVFLAAASVRRATQDGSSSPAVADQLAPALAGKSNPEFYMRHKKDDLIALNIEFRVTGVPQVVGSIVDSLEFRNVGV